MKIRRTPHARGTNLADKDQEVIRVYDDRGRFVALMGRWTVLCLPGGSVKATEASDEQIERAILGDESVLS